ncbi:zinc finger swim domain-containing protein 7-like [Moniliophthora roreri MCA 2997]|uniref:Zinc finger swim domain-containing protein 7-like n=1 Tax=Moniliophthora roreri (strain MCA 2997) TaxID=1381753 RepID=V2XVW4_MONRO|nr:zinc finger swim domain-containing protein 7-like [Moniliophthora roreri MCA 2997]
MLPNELIHLADTVVDSLESTQALSEDSIRRLHATFPDTLILAALDIIDRQNVVKNVSPWGHTNYEVSGSTATYTVHVNLSVTPLSSYCNCPTFVYAVLKSGSHAMCKHVLATRLAIKLNLCVEGSHSVDALASHPVLRHGGSR